MSQYWFRFTLFLLLLLAGVSPALAQEDDPSPGVELPPLLLATDYPSRVIGIEETASLDLTLRTGTEAQVARLSLEDLPENWTATFRGGGQVVRSVFVSPDAEATVDLRVEPPADVAPGDYAFTVIAESDVAESELPIELTVQERVPANLSLTVELPTVRGQPDTTFSYSASLVNEGGEDLTVDLSADAPPGLLITFQSGGQEVTTLPLAADETERITIQADPLSELPVGTHTFTVFARGESAETTLDLAAEVVGRPTLTLTTPDGRLSGNAEAGTATTYSLLVQNNGSATARNIEMTNTAPNDWEVSFEPAEITELPPGAQQEVTASVQPPDNAIAGDYVVTFRARPEDAGTESIEYRVTVRTSTLWGVAGVGLIAIAVLAVGVAVSRFGRR